MEILVPEIIRKKRDKKLHSKEDIESLVLGYSQGTVPDYQMAAWLMAAWLNGLTTQETVWLTESMIHSGDQIDFSEFGDKVVDKHSTGGVGDKSSLILGPIAACAGVYVPMISGRGLGHTGGTLDKLESIPGFNTQQTIEKFKKFVAKEGICFIGQTKDICPADKKMYALRDVTGTVESISLITGSIMSKKIAEGIRGLILDVKFGSGAFMNKLEDAITLAKSLVSVGKGAGLKCQALITSMNQPLGRKIGNALEVEECFEIMKWESHVEKEYKDTIELSVELAARMITLSGLEKDVEAAKSRSFEILKSGKAFEKFAAISSEQGGDVNKLPKAKDSEVLLSKETGYVTRFNSRDIGISGIYLGAGRTKITDPIDPTAGIYIHKKIGEKVEKNEPLFTVYGEKSKFEDAKPLLYKSINISESKPEPFKMIETTIE